MRMLIGIMAALMIANANAGEIGLILASKHFGRDDLNERNPGVYVRWDSTIAGTYKNSYARQSLFAGKVIAPYSRVSLFLGAVSGYDEVNGNAGGVIPMAGAVVKAGPVRIIYTPQWIGAAFAINF